MVWGSLNTDLDLLLAKPKVYQKVESVAHQAGVALWASGSPPVSSVLHLGGDAGAGLSPSFPHQPPPSFLQQLLCGIPRRKPAGPSSPSPVCKATGSTRL